MSSFASYLIGILILVVGLVIAAFLLNVPSSLIAIAVIILLALGALGATSRTSTRDAADGESGADLPQPNDRND